MKYKVTEGVYIYPEVGTCKDTAISQTVKSFVDRARRKLKGKKVILMSIKDIVKDNSVEFVRYEFDSPNDYHENLSDSEEYSFDYYYDQTLWFKKIDGGTVQVSAEGREGSVHYRVVDENGEKVHDFKIPFPELRGGRFKAQDRAIYFMRWIRKSMRE